MTDSQLNVCMTSILQSHHTTNTLNVTSTKREGKTTLSMKRSGYKQGLRKFFFPPSTFLALPWHFLSASPNKFSKDFILGLDMRWYKWRSTYRAIVSTHITWPNYYSAQILSISQITSGWRLATFTTAWYYMSCRLIQKWPTHCLRPSESKLTCSAVTNTSC